MKIKLFPIKRASILFLLLLKLYNSNAQCTGTTVSLLCCNSSTPFIFNYDIMRNGKCAFKSLPANASIAWNPGTSRWEIYTGTSYAGSVIFYSITSTATMPPNTAIGSWVVALGIPFVSLSGTGTTGSVLPLNWLDFYGNINSEKKTTLYFKVIESNVANFEIQKSSDAISFELIDIVKSIANGENIYNYTNMNVLNDVAYYRIKQIDLDGRFSYSKVIKISSKTPNKLSIFPNPISDFCTLEVDNELINTEAILFDSKGVMVQTVKIVQKKSKINLHTLKKGFYVLKTINGGVVKIVKI
jgi:Secretion system C-terminal sorting domain